MDARRFPRSQPPALEDDELTCVARVSGPSDLSVFEVSGFAGRPERDENVDDEVTSFVDRSALERSRREEPESVTMFARAPEMAKVHAEPKRTTSPHPVLSVGRPRRSRVATGAKRSSLPEPVSHEVHAAPPPPRSSPVRSSMPSYPSAPPSPPSGPALHHHANVITPAYAPRPSAPHINDFAAPGYPIVPTPFAMQHSVAPPPSSLRPWLVPPAPTSRAYETVAPARPRFSPLLMISAMTAVLAVMACMAAFVHSNERTTQASAAAAPPPAALPVAAPVVVPIASSPAASAAPVAAPVASAPAATPATTTTTTSTSTANVRVAPVATIAPPRPARPSPTFSAPPATPRAAPGPAPAPKKTVKTEGKSLEDLLTELGEEQLRR